jgi:hypothetical protein
MSMLELVKNTNEFRKLAFGENTEMIPYDDNVIKANLEELVNKAIFKGFSKAITDICCDATKLEIREGKIDNQKLIQIYEGYKKNIDNKFGNILFITINPRPDITLEEFRKSLIKFISKVWIEDYIYVMEQRGVTEEESGKGFHAHALIWKPDGKKSHEVIRETKNTFKNICSIDNPQILNIQNCKEEDINKRKNYMIGLKDLKYDPTKQEKQNIDVGWRIRNNIEPYYAKILKQ